MSVENQTIIVTGAGSGIGRAIACQFAVAGGRVIIADLNSDLGQETQSLIANAGGTSCFVKTDVTRWSDVQNMVQVARANFGPGGNQGRIDVLVNNAGILRYGYVQDFSEQDWDLTVDVNLKGTFLCAKAVVPVMIAQGGGKIINIASSAAQSYTPEYPAYVAAKVGVLGLTRAMAPALRKHGIMVVAVCPGRANTPLGLQAYREVHGRAPSPEEISVLLDPQAIARVVVDLTTPEFEILSGSVLDLR